MFAKFLSSAKHYTNNKFTESLECSINTMNGMKAKMLDTETVKTILTAQRNEITEHFIYEKLSQSTKDPHNKDALKRISNDELKHYNFWKKYTHKDAKPDKLKIWKYFLISRILGITFGIKLMERREEKAQVTYEKSPNLCLMPKVL